MSSLFMTGDFHCGAHAYRFFPEYFPEGSELGKDDYVCILGDFGRPWSHPESDRDARCLDWLDELPWTTLFIDGNHENFDALNSYPVEKWHDGKIHRLRPSVIHLMRGWIFVIAGYRLLAFGGAVSTDRASRTEGFDWWPEEVPNEEERRLALRNLATVDWSVDVVATHCAPFKLAHCADPNVLGEDATMEFLGSLIGSGSSFRRGRPDEAAKTLSYKHWYFGHYHIDKDVPAYSASAVFDRILKAE